MKTLRYLTLRLLAAFSLSLTLFGSEETGINEATQAIDKFCAVMKMTDVHDTDGRLWKKTEIRIRKNAKAIPLKYEEALKDEREGITASIIFHGKPDDLDRSGDCWLIKWEEKNDDGVIEPIAMIFDSEDGKLVLFWWTPSKSETDKPKRSITEGFSFSPHD